MREKRRQFTNFSDREWSHDTRRMQRPLPWIRSLPWSTHTEAAGLPSRRFTGPASLPWLAGFLISAEGRMWHKAAMTSPSPPPHRWYARHLAEVGESYVDHARFALGIAARCVWTAGLLGVHAVFPFLLVRNASESLARIQADVAARSKRDDA